MEPITGEWLKSVGMLSDGSDNEREFEDNILAVDTRTGEELHSTYGEPWEEVTVLGYSLDTQRPYIEVLTDGLKNRTKEVIELREVTDRAELLALIKAHKTWGYPGD